MKGRGGRLEGRLSRPSRTAPSDQNAQDALRAPANAP